MGSNPSVSRQKCRDPPPLRLGEDFCPICFIFSHCFLFLVPLLVIRMCFDCRAWGRRVLSMTLLWLLGVAVSTRVPDKEITSSQAPRENVIANAVKRSQRYSPEQTDHFVAGSSWRRHCDPDDKREKQSLWINIFTQFKIHNYNSGIIIFTVFDVQARLAVAR